MLSKLMKHEFRATSRIMLPLFLVVLVASFGAHLSIQTLVKINHPLAQAFTTLLLTIFSISVLSVCIVSFLLMIQRFYRNLLQDEGYVMMTLPVSVHQHICSKLFVSMVWYIATIAVILLSMFILSFRLDFLSALIERIQSIQWETEYIHLIFFVLELLLLGFFGCIGQCLQIYAALAISHSFSKHKLLYFFVILFGIHFLLQFLGTLGMLFLPIINWSNIWIALAPHLSAFTASHLMMLFSITISILYAIVFYCLTVFFMRERLNLE